MLFEQHGYDVLIATSGAEALQVFAVHPIDLVLLDYHMPPMNGDVVAERMKALQPDVPIAMLSADESLPENALRWADAFVSKSESFAKLLLMVERLLEVHFLFAPFDDSERRGRQQKRAA